jgi:hypothetical protein
LNYWYVNYIFVSHAKLKKHLTRGYTRSTGGNFQSTNTSMKLSDINSSVFHIIFDFLRFRDIYARSKYVNKTLNAYSKTYVCKNLYVDEQDIDTIMNLEGKDVFRMPKSIHFNMLKFTDEIWKYVNNLNIDRIHYVSCDLNNNICIPKQVKHFSICVCDNIDLKTVTPLLEKSKDTIDVLEIVMLQHIDSSDIEKIFSLNITELRFACGKSLCSDDKIILKNEDVKKLNMDKLKYLSLSNIIFDESCIDLSFLKNHKLNKLCIRFCDIDQKYLKNVIAQSLIYLSLQYTYIDDSFIEHLQVLKKNNVLNVKILDISGTQISSACFDNLRSLELTSLAISACTKINNLVGFSCPMLTKLDLGFNNFCDDDIKHALNDKLKILNISYNPKLTNVALSHIQERKLKLTELSILQFKKQKSDTKNINDESTNDGITDDIAEDNITTDGIIKYLSGMKLFSLCAPENAYNYQKFIESEVLQP